MARIVAIGGGEIGRPGYPVETIELDAEVVRLTGKRRPRVVFLPTASFDDTGYTAVVAEHYGGRLGCTVESLPLYDRSLTPAEAELMLRSADIIYVGGGNTLRMMMLWRRRGVDRVLAKAAAEGTVLAGVSAGAICWCAFGVSDSRSFTAAGDSWSYIAVRGLGLVDLVLCPHYDSEPGRPDGLPRLVERTRRNGLGLDDCTALEVVDSRWRILSSRDGGVGHYMNRRGQEHELLPDERFRPLADLVAS